jgi:hypothetical protein
MRLGIAIIAIAALGSTLTTPALAKKPDRNEGQVRVVVSLAPMNFIPEGTENTDADLAVATGNEGLVFTETFTGTEAEVEAAIADWKQTALTEGVEPDLAPGTIGTMAKHTAFGDCGYSSVELRDWDYSTYNRVGYLKAEFSLNRSATTYVTDVLIFSSSIIDGWTAHVYRSGNLNGGTYWSTAGQVVVPKAQNYGATLVRAIVQTSGGSCDTSGPRVDGVWIN